MTNNKYVNLFYKNNKINYIFTIIGYVGLAIANIGIAFILQSIMDAALSGEVTNLKNALYITVLYILGLLLIMLFKKHYCNLFIKKASVQYKDGVFYDLLKKNVNAFDNEYATNYISAFSNDIATIESDFLLGKILILFQSVLLAGGLGAMLYLNWKLMLAVLLACLLSIGSSMLYGDRLMACEVKVSDLNATFLTSVKELLSGFSVVKSFKAENEVNSLFQKKNCTLEEIKRKKRNIRDNIYIVAVITSYFVNIVVFAVGSYLVIRKEITIGVVVAYIQLVNYVVSPIQELGQLISCRKSAKKLIEKVYHYVQFENLNDGIEDLNDFNQDIIIKNLDFSFDEDNPVLSNINLKFEKGKKYAIVGASGSGKSTLINLLMGNYRNYSGEINLDGKEIRTIKIEHLFEHISVIQQNVFIFDSTITENITMFKPFSSDKINKSIKQSGLEELVLQKGENYMCGENGSKLSGGERQRISIARSLIRKCSVLLMDEGTSALDTITSAMIEDTILGIEGVTSIIVSHKLNENILRRYNEIIVLNKGQVVEQGNFQQLLDKKGYFYKLFDIALII